MEKADYHFGQIKSLDAMATIKLKSFEKALKDDRYAEAYRDLNSALHIVKKEEEHITKFKAIVADRYFAEKVNEQPTS